jgi:YD repeat-containing protein
MTSGGSETFTYDSRGLRTSYYPPPTESDPNPQNHPTQYFYTNDRLSHVIDPRGNDTWIEYNERGQITKITHDDLSYSQIAYNADGTLAWTADENHPGALTDPNQRTSYTYDAYKRLRSITTPLRAPGDTTNRITNRFGGHG